jgi:hypothetical protein
MQVFVLPVSQPKVFPKNGPYLMPNRTARRIVKTAAIVAFGVGYESTQAQ